MATLRDILDARVREADASLYQKLENQRVRCFYCGHNEDANSRKVAKPATGLAGSRGLPNRYCFPSPTPHISPLDFLLNLR